MAAVWRGLKLGLKGLALCMGVLALAWVASNVRDDAPASEPESLRLSPAAAGSPLFFRLQGLMAAPGESPEAVGRQDWQRLHAVGVPAGAASAPVEVPRLEGFKSGPLSCLPPEDCQKRLTTSADAIARQLEPLALLGERCLAALEDPRYEEPRAAAMNLNTPLPAYQGAVNCAKWFKGQALRAAFAGDRVQTMAQLGHGRRLLDALLSGTETLIGQMVTATLVRGHLDAVVAVTTLQPAWVPELRAFVTAWPPGAQDARRWIVTERAFVRGTLVPALTACADMGGLLPLGDATSWLACKTGVGLLPHATLNAMDRFWAQEVQAAGQGLDTALGGALAAAQQPVAPLVWRNTLGHLLLGVAKPGFAAYYARQADVELQRQAVALWLAAQVQAVPRAERAAWLSRQDLPAPWRARLSWSEDGQVLQVRPWMAELPGTDPRRQPWHLRTAV